MLKKPWEIDKRLAKPCICEVGKIIKHVRHKTISLHDPDNGDGPWSLGCRIYERTINTFVEKSKILDWLGYIKDNLYFVVLVNGVPIRFYRGTVEEPTNRTLRRLSPERKATQLLFDFEEPEWFWRIVVDTELNGEVLRLVLAQFDEMGGHQNPWEIPISRPVAVMTPVDSIRRESVVLDKPNVSPRKQKEVGDIQDAVEK